MQTNPAVLTNWTREKIRNQVSIRYKNIIIAQEMPELQSKKWHVFMVHGVHTRRTWEQV